MDFISDKVTMLVGEASSRVNETRRKWQQQRDTRRQQGDALDRVQPAEAIDDQLHQTSPANRITNLRSDATITPLAGGFPFGGDMFPQTHSLRGPLQPPPPPIGFKIGPAGAPSRDAAPSQSQQSEPAPARSELGESDESLYKGDAWARLWFQRVLILSLLRLLLFVRKVYEDFHATKVYNVTGQTGHFLIAATTLFLPTIVFTVYRVSRYLQLSLPPLRVASHSQQPYPRTGQKPPEAAESSAEATNKKRRSANRRDDDAQLTRALMSSPVQSTTDSVVPLEAAGAAPASAAPDENEGLVTARQTPTNVDEFHDSKSQQEATLESQRPVDEVVPRAPSRANRLKASPTSQGSASGGTPQPLESVKIERLLPDSTADRATTRVVTGASEQLLHGVLFIFWQLKRQVDVMGYLVERACLWRKPAEREKEELGRLRTGSDGLEWFQDFYAAFLAILTQVYTLGLHWTGEHTMAKHLSASQVGAATGGLASSDGATSSGSDASASNTVRAVSSLLSSHALSGDVLSGKDVLIMSELIVSTAVVLSLLVAVRRRDDGPLTLALSFLGWGSLFSARIIIIALSFVQFGWHLMLPLVLVHVLLITGWVYSIAIASHNDIPAERLDEAQWDEETAIEVTNQHELNDLKEDAPEGSGQTEEVSSAQVADEARTIKARPHQTSDWSFMEHLVLLAQILILFAIPSLFYWPIMFNLKRHFRPFKYLVLILFENFFLITAIWFKMSSTATEAAASGQLYLLGAVGGFSIVGFIFISLYIMCKPSLTEYFARADELFNQAEKSGIYYEFCSRVFKMPDLNKQTFLRLMNQSEAVEEEIVDGEEEDKEEE